MTRGRLQHLAERKRDWRIGASGSEEDRVADPRHTCFEPSEPGEHIPQRHAFPEAVAARAAGGESMRHCIVLTQRMGCSRNRASRSRRVSCAVVLAEAARRLPGRSWGDDLEPPGLGRQPGFDPGLVMEQVGLAG